MNIFLNFILRGGGVLSFSREYTIYSIMRTNSPTIQCALPGGGRGGGVLVISPIRTVLVRPVVIVCFIFII